MTETKKARQMRVTEELKFHGVYSAEIREGRAVATRDGEPLRELFASGTPAENKSAAIAWASERL